jgi:molybdenum cofactor cytidylyltransferase
MTQRVTGHFDAIVLAAGRGVRFGGGKLTALLEGAPLVEGSVLTALLAPVGRVIVAVGPEPEVRQAVEGTATRLLSRERLLLVSIDDPSAGMGVSLATAARSVEAGADGVFVFLGDMPRIDPATPARLASAFRRSSDIVAPTYLGRRGHPVLFGSEWLPSLSALSGDEGARALVDTAGENLVRVPVDDPGVHLDVDRPGDLARVRTEGKAT